MNNKDIYKKSLDQIHAPEDLKQKTFEKMTEKKKESFIPLKLLSAAAAFLLVFAVGYNYYENEDINYVEDKIEFSSAQVNEYDLPRFRNIQELRNVLKENETIYATNGVKSADMAVLESATEESVTTNDSEKNIRSVDDLDYSKTNNQVESVDEADIVKTDGKYIYYAVNGIVNIIDADSLELLSEIRGYRNNDETFNPYKIFINNNKLVVIGEYSKYETKNERIIDDEEDVESKYIDRVYTNYINMSKALIYNLENIREPKIEREIELDGYFKDARMIGDNVYLISIKHAGYYGIYELKDEEILPTVRDTTVSEESVIVPCTDIAYFPGSKSYSFMLIGGFNINNNNPLNVETFFGAGDTIYCSENNLYLTQAVYDDNYRRSNVDIYKFELNNSQVIMKTKGTVEGYINNQFSLDEYEGNLRIATTVITKPFELNEETGEYENEKTTNRVYILNDKLEEISRIDNMADGERIYAVRFIGKIGYVVTFEQVDPLFVLDLSDPKKPEIKGELKIPGYSSYLHPYDETHIIGIGYNTRPNGYGGVTNSNMKMSMFDVSDLNNPTEMFSIDIGEDYAYSNLLHDHKALFYKASDSLIGFPYSTYSYNGYGKNKWVFEIFHIDLENGFERYGEFIHDYDYNSNINRMIYIGNTLYGLAPQKVISYDMYTQEIIHELELNMLENMDYILE